MKPPIYIFVNGIMNDPGAAHGWNDRAVTWIQTRTEAEAEKFKYFCDIIFRRLFQFGHARDLAEMISDYAGREIHLVGHSNGCDLICRALNITETKVAGVHLLSGACDADFQLNGLNVCMAAGQVDFIYCYVAGQDFAMKCASLSQRFLRWLGLGYGILGFAGPKSVAFTTRVRTITENSFGHSTWFLPENFDRTMERITDPRSLRITKTQTNKLP